MFPFVCLNGEFLPIEEAKVSVFDHGFLYGDGIFETLKTKDGVLFDAQEHINRLWRSAKLMKIDLPWTQEQIATWANELVEKSRLTDDVRLKIMVTRGQNHFIFTGSRYPTICMILAPLKDFSAERAEGVSVVTIPAITRLLPNAKTTALLPMILAKQAAEAAGAFETLFLDEEGIITEGSVCNILLRFGQEIWVSRPEKVLWGTAQRLILDAVKKPPFVKGVGGISEKKYQIIEKDFTPADALAADEVLLMNSVFGVLWVREVDGQQCKESEKMLFEEVKGLF